MIVSHGGRLLECKAYLLNHPCSYRVPGINRQSCKSCLIWQTDTLRFVRKGLETHLQMEEI